MKLLRKLTSVMLICALVITVFMAPSMEASAAPSVSALKKLVPSKVRIYPESEYTYGSAGSKTAIYVPYANKENVIANIKASSKNLIAKQTYNSAGTEYDTTKVSSYGTIGLYAKKEGTYTVKFDVLSKKGGSKVYSKTVTVYAKTDSPIKSVKYAGKDVYDYKIATKKSGKLKVSMSKGYTLKSIEIGKYVMGDVEKKDYSYGDNIDTYESQKSTIVYSVIGNNKTITLGTVQDYSYEKSYENSSYRKSMNNRLDDSFLAPTFIRITYKDKYTKQEMTTSYCLYQFAK